jgi:hypothetical protein
MFTDFCAMQHDINFKHDYIQHAVDAMKGASGMVGVVEEGVVEEGVVEESAVEVGVVEEGANYIDDMAFTQPSENIPRLKQQPNFLVKYPLDQRNNNPAVGWHRRMTVRNTTVRRRSKAQSVDVYFYRWVLVRTR